MRENFMRGVAQALGEGEIEVREGERPRSFPKVERRPKARRKTRPKKRRSKA